MLGNEFTQDCLKLGILHKSATEFKEKKHHRVPCASRTNKKDDALGGLVKLNFGQRITEKKRLLKHFCPWCGVSVLCLFILYLCECITLGK